MKVSVVVPTFDRAPQLERLLESLAAQRSVPGGFEVIVADDGSTDGTPSVVERFSGRLDVRRVAQTNRGPAAARNLGAGVARGALLAFVDSDCVAHADWLQTLRRAHESAPAAVIYGPVQSGIPAAPPFVHAFSMQGGHVPGANLLMERALWERLGGFDEQLRISEDNDFTERVREAGVPLVYAPDARVDHPPSVRRWSLWAAARSPDTWAQLRYYYRKHPQRRVYESSPLRIAVRAGAKAALIGAGAAVLGPAGALLGWAALAARSLWNVRRAASVAARAHLRLRAADCAAYVLFGWLGDFVSLWNYARSGVGS